MDTCTKKITIKKNYKDFEPKSFVWQLTDRHHKTLPSRTKRCSTKVLYLLLVFSFRVVSYGLAVRIPGFHQGFGLDGFDFRYRNQQFSGALSDMLGCFTNLAIRNGLEKISIDY